VKSVEFDIIELKRGIRTEALPGLGQERALHPET
jgi:hypothetical protein